MTPEYLDVRRKEACAGLTLKPIRCNSCGKRIAVNTEYIRVQVRTPFGWGTLKYHKDCE